MDGRYAATSEDVKAIISSVLRHRIVTNFNAEADGVEVMQIIGRLMETVKAEDE